MIKFTGNHFKNYHEEWGYESPKDLAEDLASNLNLSEGDLYWSSDRFTARGTLTNGKKLFIGQYGEYSMYGGPYEPKMKKPEIEVDGKEFPVSLITKTLKDAGYEIGWSGSHNFPDLPTMSREWGHLLLLKEVTVKAAMLGLV